MALGGDYGIQSVELQLLRIQILRKQRKLLRHTAGRDLLRPLKFSLTHHLQRLSASVYSRIRRRE